MPFFELSVVPAVIIVFVWGCIHFATGSPLQARIVDQAKGAPNLASTLNQGAFNLGNALGASLGGIMLTAGISYRYLSLGSAAVASVALLVALIALRVEQSEKKIRWCRSKRGSYGEKNISRKGPRNCRSLGCARDDKGKGRAAMEMFSTDWSWSADHPGCEKKLRRNFMRHPPLHPELSRGLQFRGPFLEMFFSPWGSALHAALRQPAPEATTYVHRKPP